VSAWIQNKVDIWVGGDQAGHAFKIYCAQPHSPLFNAGGEGGGLATDFKPLSKPISGLGSP